MSEKSHVGMFQCFFCGKNMGVLLHKRLAKVLPEKCGAIDMEPCEDCKKMMDMGIMIIGCDESKSDAKSGNFYRTGSVLVVKPDFIIRNFKPPELVKTILELGFTFMSEEIVERIRKECGE